jgi:hypothetical protein
MPDDPPWLRGCLEKIGKIPGALPCPQERCDERAWYLHNRCSCYPPYDNGCDWDDPQPGCCERDDTSPIMITNPDGSNCFCCCGYWLSGTLVAASAEHRREISEFLPGDPVRVALDARLSRWAAVPVAFSAGTGPGSRNAMIRVNFGAAEAPENIYVTRDHVFMVQGHLLKRASRLVPGQDKLMRADGGLAPVLDLTAGMFSRAVHRISSSDTPAASPSGHLLAANGLVCGDYSLQLADLDAVAPELLVPGHAHLPELGTKEYGERYRQRSGEASR